MFTFKFILRCFDVNLYEEKLVYLDAFPSVGEVFAVDLGNDGLHRAVHNVNIIGILGFIQIIFNVYFTISRRMMQYSSSIAAKSWKTLLLQT